MSVVVGAFTRSCLAIKVCVERGVNLIGVELAANAAGAKVIGVVAHARILPVDEVILVGLVDEEVEIEEVIVAEALWRFVRSDILFETIDFRGHLPVSPDVDGSLLEEKRFVALCLLVEVKLGLNLSTRFVEGAAYLHHLGHLDGVVGVGLLRVRYELGDLPPSLRVLVNERIVQAELLGFFERGVLASTVNEELGAYAGMTIDILAIVGGKVAAEICKALLEGIDIMNLCLGAPKDFRDVVEDFRVDVLEEMRVKGTKLVKRVKLVDNAGGVGAHRHVEFLDVVDVEVFPQLIDGLRVVVLAFENLDKALRERAVKVDMSEHVPRV